ncbi:Transcription initiation factor IIA subunit 1 [Frankliniella fusca]|uniref:Transcription initiation factor IIA subunit 1 n=1 Tax=Frankliniella fusca TaxID=407009 RepID=A0AAE1LN92_9NEOP|nr:Transcription initiation factor IIA subunit 1 [Frankliniella fusca]
MALSQTGVLKLYNSVIEDVITGVREAFLDEGVDDQVLQELKQLWEMKLNSNKAVEVPELLEPTPPLLGQKSNSKSGIVAVNLRNVLPISAPVQTAGMNASNGTTLIQSSGTMPLAQGLTQSGVSQTIATAQQQLARLQQPVLQPAQSQIPLLKSQPVQQPPTQTTQQNTQQTTFATLSSDPNRQVPIQITLPAQAGAPDAQPRVLTIHVPASALTGNQLQQVLTGPVISATMNLPLALACSLLQQHVNAALQGQAANAAAQLQSSANNQNNGVANFGHQSQTANTISQLDGALDTSEEEDDDDDDDDDFDEDDDMDEHEDDENNENEGGAEEEPLNSEDDVSDDDPQDLFDTENVVVCQYDKITRTRNKWKFYLKDGIMNLNGKDFVFQRATGDAEW